MPSDPHLAFDASLAATTVPRVAVEAAVAAALLAREADGTQLGLLARVDAVDARGPQQCPTPLGGQRLQKEAVIHLHTLHVQVLIRDVIQGEELSLGTFHRSVTG